MIETLLQYEITRTEIKRFRAAIAEWESYQEEPPVHPLLWQAAGDALRSQLASLEEELEEYNRQYRQSS